jgi:hypothetical protein
MQVLPVAPMTEAEIAAEWRWLARCPWMEQVQTRVRGFGLLSLPCPKRSERNKKTALRALKEWEERL